jgi:hypothetical protein
LGAGVTLADVDVLQLYDSFTITVLLTLEDLGFCAKERAALRRDGRLAFDGRSRRTPTAAACRRATRDAGDVPDRGGGAPAARPGRRRRCPTRRSPSHGTGGMLSTGATLLLGTEAP